MSGETTRPQMGISLWEDSYRRFKKDKIGVLCFLVIVFYAVMAVLGFIEVFGDPSLQIENASKQPPSLQHVFGTNILGQDVLARVAGGTWIAIGLGMSTALLSTLIGGVLGAIAGWFGGWVDEAVVWLYSTVASIPSLVLIMAVAFVFKTNWGEGMAFLAVFLAMGLTYWVGTCRIVRGEFMKLKERDYVMAGRAMGFGNGRIIFAHIMPNAAHLLIIMATLIFVQAIKSEVVISFLGVGMTDMPSWGMIIQDAESELTKGQWWQMTFTSIALFGIVLASQVFGDSLRDALDPRLRT